MVAASSSQEGPSISPPGPSGTGAGRMEVQRSELGSAPCGPLLANQFGCLWEKSSAGPSTACRWRACRRWACWSRAPKPSAGASTACRWGASKDCSRVTERRGAECACQQGDRGRRCHDLPHPRSPRAPVSVRCAVRRHGPRGCSDGSSGLNPLLRCLITCSRCPIIRHLGHLGHLDQKGSAPVQATFIWHPNLTARRMERAGGETSDACNANCFQRGMKAPSSSRNARRSASAPPGNDCMHTLRFFCC